MNVVDNKGKLGLGVVATTGEVISEETNEVPNQNPNRDSQSHLATTTMSQASSICRCF